MGDSKISSMAEVGTTKSHLGVGKVSGFMTVEFEVELILKTLLV